jgi:uncharacterized protein
MTLPAFRYHPDPVKSGSVIASDKSCRVCGENRGYIYTGPVYSEEELDEEICPWCIADGSAHDEFDATFVDDLAFSDDLPIAVAEEITERTPGFNSWQPEQWPCCCGDGTAFLQPAGIKELRQEQELEGIAMGYIVHEMGISGGAARRLLDSLDRDKGPTAYLFRCLQCNRHHLYIDQV